jgi:predicted ATPase
VLIIKNLKTKMDAVNIHQFIRKVALRTDKIESFDEYPYSLPAIKNFETLTLHPKVTYIIGENGSGKSTLLEAIAVAFGLNAEGGTANFNFSTHKTHSNLHESLTLVKGSKRPDHSFFLRAESFYNLATNIDELGAIGSYGGVSLHEQSHGESFFSVIMNRFKGNGLYILDEPEAALSPSKQLALLVRMDELIKKNAQFIIATHAPIVMAYPDSLVYEINNGIFEKVKCEETEHFKVMKSFMDNPKNMLNMLLGRTS